MRAGSNTIGVQALGGVLAAARGYHHTLPLRSGLSRTPKLPECVCKCVRQLAHELGMLISPKLITRSWAHIKTLHLCFCPRPQTPQAGLSRKPKGQGSSSAPGCKAPCASAIGRPATNSQSPKRHTNNSNERRVAAPAAPPPPPPRPLPLRTAPQSRPRCQQPNPHRSH